MKHYFLLSTLILVFFQFGITQESNFIFTKGDDNISTITMGSERSPHCTVFEYPDFLVLHEIPSIPMVDEYSSNVVAEKINPLVAFIDSVYDEKPIRYILNSHHHGHSLSTVIPFLERGAKLVTATENLEVYDKRGLFGDKGSDAYSESIIEVADDTVLLATSDNPIEVLYLKKADYKSIPTKTYLFFNFPEKKLLATSCMVYLRDIEEKYGYKGIMYNNRLVNVNQIIVDKGLDVEETLQLYRFRYKDEQRGVPVFSMSHLQNVLEYSWHRLALSENLQKMSNEEITAGKDSLLSYFIEADIYHIVLNHAVYQLIEKEEYQKAVALAQILVTYKPDRMDEIDTLGEAYYNNGQVVIAKYYDKILRSSKEDTDGLGLAIWESNNKERLKKGS